MFRLYLTWKRPHCPLARCLDQLNRCTLALVFDWEDINCVRAWSKIDGRPAGAPLDDDDLEFMFRHADPSPTFDNMDACGCI